MRAGPTPEQPDDQAGFGLVEVMVAVVILSILVASLGNLLVDSMAAGLLAKQRDAAASLASDVAENAIALGQTSLSATTADSACWTVSSGSPVPVLTGGASGNFQQCFTTTIGPTAYTVTPLVTTISSQPDTVAVSVSWDNGAHTFLTTTQVGS